MLSIVGFTAVGSVLYPVDPCVEVEVIILARVSLQVEVLCILGVSCR